LVYLPFFENRSMHIGDTLDVTLEEMQVLVLLKTDGKLTQKTWQRRWTNPKNGCIIEKTISRMRNFTGRKNFARAKWILEKKYGIYNR